RGGDLWVAGGPDRADGSHRVLADARREVPLHVDQHLDVAGGRIGREAHLRYRAYGHAAQADRGARLEPARAREVHLVLRLALPEGLLLVEREDGHHEDGEGDGDQEPDLGGLHQAAFRNSCRKGSREARASSGVPMKRMRPSCRKAIRSATRKALTTSWVTTTEPTARGRCAAPTRWGL